MPQNAEAPQRTSNHTPGTPPHGLYDHFLAQNFIRHGHLPQHVETLGMGQTWERLLPFEAPPPSTLVQLGQRRIIKCFVHAGVEDAKQNARDDGWTEHDIASFYNSIRAVCGTIVSTKTTLEGEETFMVHVILELHDAARHDSPLFYAAIHLIPYLDYNGELRRLCGKAVAGSAIDTDVLEDIFPHIPHRGFVFVPGQIPDDMQTQLKRFYKPGHVPPPNHNRGLNEDAEGTHPQHHPEVQRRSKIDLWNERTRLEAAQRQKRHRFLVPEFAKNQTLTPERKTEITQRLIKESPEATEVHVQRFFDHRNEESAKNPHKYTHHARQEPKKQRARPLNTKERAELEKEIAGRKSLTHQQKLAIVDFMCAKYPDAGYNIKRLNQHLRGGNAPAAVNSATASSSAPGSRTQRGD